MNRQTLAAVALVGLIALTGCATTPDEVRTLGPTLVMKLSKPSMEAAECIAAQMDEQLPPASNHAGPREWGASVVSIPIKLARWIDGVGWVVDLIDVADGSVARLYVSDIVLNTDEIERGGRQILEECALP